MRRLAIFDIDGTLFRSSLIIELIEELIEQDIFPKSMRDMYLREQGAWLDRRGSYEDYIMKLVVAFEKHLKGVSYKDFTAAAKVVTVKKKDRVYRYTRDLIKKLKQEDYYLLAVSQSPKAILEPFGKGVGFDKIYGRIYEVGPSERFTGGIEDLNLIANKANIVKRVLEKEKLTLDGSVGVGDTEGDIAFLEMVEEPICFNPNAALYKHAKRLGWKVVVERKDVVYEL